MDNSFDTRDVSKHLGQLVPSTFGFVVAEGATVESFCFFETRLSTKALRFSSCPSSSSKSDSSSAGPSESSDSSSSLSLFE